MNNFIVDDYSEKHDIYVGTHTGALKKFTPGYDENPFMEHKLMESSVYCQCSPITSLEFGDMDRTNILIGRKNPTVQLYTPATDQVDQNVKYNVRLPIGKLYHIGQVVGMGRRGDMLVVGLSTGRIQSVSLNAEYEAQQLERRAGRLSVTTDNFQLTIMRMCPTQRNLVAVAGEAYTEVFDMEVLGHRIFPPNGLVRRFVPISELPIKDVDAAFIDSHLVATCSPLGYVRVYDTRKSWSAVKRLNRGEMGFTKLATHGNYIYTSTTKNEIKTFDLRRLRSVVRTYRGFSGDIIDFGLDDSGKYLASSSADNFVRLHSVRNSTLVYQCYNRAKAMQVLVREGDQATE